MAVTLVQLAYLAAVDQFRHFGQAADHCRVTQPTLSMQLQKLERELGVELIDRTRHPVEPTDVGRLVVAQARQVLREASRLREITEQVGTEVVGELRVGVLPTLAPYVLPRVLMELTRKYPRLQLRVDELQTDQIVQALDEERLDVAILATPVARSGWTQRVLFREVFAGYLSDGHRLSGASTLRTEDLRLNDLWLLREGHCFRDQVVRLCESSPRAEGDFSPLRFETGNLETLKRMVEQSGGMTLLPALAVLEMTAEERTRVRRFEPPEPSRVVQLVHARSYLKRGSIEALCAELLALAPGGEVRVTGA
jgi:LysR family transcriptional regulator, hydrogen peroxide-inducible genes activator